MAAGPDSGSRLIDRVRTRLAPLTGSAAISMTAWLLISPFGVYLSVVTNIVLPDATILNTTLAGLAGVLATGALLLFADRTFFRNRADVPVRLWQVAALYAFVGVVRSWVSGQAYVALVGAPEINDWPGRLVAGAFIGLTWYGLAALIVALLREQRDRRRQELAARKLQTRLRSQSATRLRQELDSFRELVEGRLLPLLDHLESQLAAIGNSAAKSIELAAEVRAICQDEVRAASHKLAEDPAAADVSLPPSPRPALSSALRRAFERPQLNPAWSAIWLTIMAVPISIIRGGPPAAIAVALVAAAGYTVAYFVDRTFIDLFGSRLVWLRQVIDLSVVVAHTWLALWVLPSWVIVPSYKTQMFWVSPVGILLTWWSVNTFTGSMEAARRAVQELAAANQELQLTIHQLHFQRRQLRRAQANLLHGPVQGRLSAVSMALSMHAQQPDAGWLEQASEQLVSARTALTDAVQTGPVVDEAPQQLRRLLSETTDQWAGLLDVELEVTDAADRALAATPLLIEDVNEAVAECLTNAVRHGRSRKAKVLVNAPQGLDSLVLTVTNDGTLDPVSAGESGLGGAFLASVGATREITQVREGVRVVIRWPLHNQ